MGTYTVTGTAVGGTANKVEVPNFDGPGKAREGYFYACRAVPNDGVEIRTSTHPEKWIPLHGEGEDGELLILLGEDAPTMEWYEARAEGGPAVRIDLTGITAAAPVALKAKAAVKRAAKKTPTKEA